MAQREGQGHTIAKCYAKCNSPYTPSSCPPLLSYEDETGTVSKIKDKCLPHTNNVSVGRVEPLGSSWMARNLSSCCPMFLFAPHLPQGDTGAQVSDKYKKEFAAFSNCIIISCYVNLTYCRNSPIAQEENYFLPAEETNHFYQFKGLPTEYLFGINYLLWSQVNRESASKGLHWFDYLHISHTDKFPYSWEPLHKLHAFFVGVRKRDPQQGADTILVWTKVRSQTRGGWSLKRTKRKKALNTKLDIDFKLRDWILNLN